MIQRISRNADLIFSVSAPIAEADMARMRAEICEHFSGHRVMVLRAGDIRVIPLDRSYKRPYRPSMLAHGGRG